MLIILACCRLAKKCNFKYFTARGSHMNWKFSPYFPYRWCDISHTQKTHAYFCLHCGYEKWFSFDLRKIKNSKLKKDSSEQYITQSIGPVSVQVFSFRNMCRIPNPTGNSLLKKNDPKILNPARGLGCQDFVLWPPATLHGKTFSHRKFLCSSSPCHTFNTKVDPLQMNIFAIF